MDRVGRKTAYAGDFKNTVRGNSVQIKDQDKIDPFAHLTPVARRFIENNELVTTKAYSNNNSKRMNSTGAGTKRVPAESPTQRFDASDASYSPRRGNLQPANNQTKFTTTVIGPFRSKGGYSAPEQKKRDLGYVDISQGPLFNTRITTAIKGADKRNSENTMKIKAQLPNVSKQRVQIKSHNDRLYQNANPTYPNAIMAQNINRANNSSSKRRDIPAYPNTSFQITNNFIQTSYGGMGNLNQTQMMNKTGYGALVHDGKPGGSQTNTSRASKKYRFTNFYPSAGTPSNNQTIYLRKQNKNLFNIYKTKQQNRGEPRNKSPSSPRNKSTSPKSIVPTHQLFGKQFGHPIPRPSGSQQRKIVINDSGRGNYSPRTNAEMEYPGIMNNTMTGGFVNTSFGITGNAKLNLSNISKNTAFKNQLF